MNAVRTKQEEVDRKVLSDGVPSLLFRIAKSAHFRIRQQVNRISSIPRKRAVEQINHIAARNIPNSEKFSLIYQKRLCVKLAPHLNPDKSLSGFGSTVTSTSVFRRQLEQFL